MAETDATDTMIASTPIMAAPVSMIRKDAGRSGVLSITQDSGVVRVTGLGHTLLLPLDEDQQRAATSYNTVQLDTRRVQGRTATLVNGNLYLPLDTLASGLGAQYEQGKFTLAAPKLVSVSSRAGRDTDRVVLDLSRDVDRKSTRLNSSHSSVSRMPSSA